MNRTERGSHRPDDSANTEQQEHARKIDLEERLIELAARLLELEIKTGCLG